MRLGEFSGTLPYASRAFCCLPFADCSPAVRSFPRIAANVWNLRAQGCPPSDILRLALNQELRVRLNIRGLSGLAHDSSAALLSDGGIVAAMEESKLVRRRTAAGIPREAIRFCLERSGTGWSGVECVAVGSRPVRNWGGQALMR